MIAVIIWYVWMQVFAFCGLLVTSRWLRPLPDRGYGISKVAGIILAGFFYWIAVSIGIARNDVGAVILSLLIMAALGVLLHLTGNAQPDSIQSSRGILPSIRSIVATEILFLMAFVSAAIYKAYNPEIVEAGGEKFMEFMLLNSILRSPGFPPNDAWLSGFSISYYYFGYVIMAMLTRISGIAPGIAFNLSGAMFFALTVTSAFSVGYNLWSIRERNTRLMLNPDIGHAPPTSHKPSLKPLIAGLLTAMMLAVMGNLGGLMESARCAGAFPASFWHWLDIRNLEQKPVECDGLRPTRFYWWWDWSRVIHDYSPLGADQEVITETPAFSFILGDNHPHVMSLPLVLLVVTLALHYLRTGLPALRMSTVESAGGLKAGAALIFAWLAQNAVELALLAIVLGGLSFMNTWDLPVFGGLVVGASLVYMWQKRQNLLPLLFYVAAVILGYVLYLPFYATFSSQARGIGINLFNGTRVVQFFMMFAPFLIAMLSYVLYITRASNYSIKKLIQRTFVLSAAGLVLTLISISILGVFSPQVRGWITELNTNGSVMGLKPQDIINRIALRFADPWVAIMMLLTIAASVILLTRRQHDSSTDHNAESRAVSTDNFVLMLFMLGALLALAVEFIFLQDLFGTRMNTVFKFYYQAWTLWAIGSAYAIMTFFSIRRWFARGAAILILALVGAGLLYPLYASLSKTNDFSSVPNLDGTAYLTRNKPDDAAMIKWLNANVDGDPVIIEAPTSSYGAYQYNGRISAFTGLPTILGWAGHQNQWRGSYSEPARREPLIESLYNTTDISTAQSIIRQFNISYVIVGELERGKYEPEGLGKFNQICVTAFHTGTSTVYKCNPR